MGLSYRVYFWVFTPSVGENIFFKVDLDESGKDCACIPE